MKDMSRDELVCEVATLRKRVKELEKRKIKHRDAEEALQESEERYRLFMEAANEGIFIIQDGVIKNPNPKMGELLGYAADDLEGHALADFVLQEDRDVALAWCGNRDKEKSFISTCVLNMIAESGQNLWVEVSSILIKWEGKAASLNFMRDITLQKKFESQIFQTQKMDAIGTLAGGIAHDFNNLLMGIQGYVSLMLLNTGPKDTHFEKLKSIEKQVKSGAELTNQLIGFAKCGNYEIAPVDLNDLVKIATTMFGRTRKEICIHENYRQDLCTVEMERSQIERVLMQLYVNAWQAMPKGGDLYIETSNVTLDKKYLKPFKLKPGHYAKISVTDTGVGMDEKTRKRVFEPFFTTREMKRGAGLGLAYAYGVIENHNGLINVYSEKGHGTTFNIYLPATNKKIVKKEEEEDLSDGLQTGETVLLVEDEDIIVDVGREILAVLGYNVLVARNGAEAIEIYGRHKDDIALVVLDMIMPGMSGKETYNGLKSVNPDVKVLLASGYAVTSEAASILESGCNGFIQKPFTIGDLSGKVRSLLNH